LVVVSLQRRARKSTGYFVETWFAASWIDHLRHHDRGAGEDRNLQERIAILLADGAAPEVNQYLAADQAALK
jgi:hypothetical protein